VGCRFDGLQSGGYGDGDGRPPDDGLALLQVGCVGNSSTNYNSGDERPSLDQTDTQTRLAFFLRYQIGRPRMTQ